MTSPPGSVDSEDLLDSPPVAEPAPSSAEADAARAYSEGDLARAIAIYRELGANHPDTAERTRLRVTVAWLLFEQGDRSAAGQELGQALFQDPAFVPRQDLYGPEFLALYQDAQAEAARERTRAASRRLQEGLGAFNAGDRVKARALFDESLSLVAQQPRALQALAALDLAEGKLDAALAGFQRVLALERGSPELVPRELKAQTLNNIGVIFYGREQFEDAADSLERATALNPRDARSWFNLGLARLALGRKSDGLEALKRAHDLDRKDAEISLRLARTHAEAASWVEAVALLFEATTVHPEDPTLWLELGKAQRGLGNRDGMTGSLHKTIELDADGSRGAGGPAAIALAEAALAARDFGSAGREAAIATRLLPRDATAWALLGLARQGEGNLVEAAASLEQAATLAPTRADIAHNLGTVYLGQRRFPEAEGAFRQALQLDPNAAESSAALARLQASRASTGGKSAPRPAPAPPPRDLGARLSPVDYQPLGIRGLLVDDVAPSGLAARSGLLPDDLILRADGRPATQVPTLLALVRSSTAAAIELSVLRSGKPVEIQLKLR